MKFIKPEIDQVLIQFGINLVRRIARPFPGYLTTPSMPVMADGIIDPAGLIDKDAVPYCMAGQICIAHDNLYGIIEEQLKLSIG